MPHHTRDEGRGVFTNHRLVAFVHDIIGREVVVDTRDGTRYEGIFVACSPNFEIGLQLAHQVPPAGSKKLLPHVNEVVEKLQFEASDVICVSAVVQDEKLIRGFATDKEYSIRRNGAVGAADLAGDLHFEEWEADGEEEFELDDRSTHSTRNARLGGLRGGNEGWSVDEMFRTNRGLGVKSTFDEDLSQYTTAEVEGTREERAMAEKIAREIEKNPASRTNAMLENDDEERNLDVSYAASLMDGCGDREPRRGGGAGATMERGGGGVMMNSDGEKTAGGGRSANPGFENDDDDRSAMEKNDFHSHSHRKGNPTSGRNSYSGNARGGGVGNAGGSRNTSQSSNRRADGGMQGGGKGRGGSYGSGGNTSRSFMNSSLSHGGKGSGGSQSSGGGYGPSSGRYQPSMERSTSQTMHGDISQWSDMRRGETSGGGSPSVGGGAGSKGSQGRRGAESSSIGSTGGSGAVAPSKVYESSSHRGHHGANSPLNRSVLVEDGRSGGHHGGSPHGTGGSPSGGGGGKGSMAGGGPSPAGGTARGGGAADRYGYKTLRDFHTNFDSAYQPSSQRSHSTHSSLDDDQSGASTATSVTTAASTPVNNAWNKGPPMSIRSTSTASSIPTGVSSPKEPTPAESTSHIVDHSLGTSKVKGGHPASSVSSVGSGGSQTASTSGASVESQSSSSSSEATPRRVHSASASGSDQTIVPKTSPLPQPASTSSIHPTQTVMVGSSTDTSIASVAGSTSSIAPTDPTPSISSTVTDGGKKNDFNTPEKGKKFEFNPDAPIFTPRSAASHLVAAQVATGSSQPLIATPHPTPVPLQAIPINTPQGIPLTQGMQPGSMVAHPGPPQVFPYPAGASVYTVPVYYPHTAMIQAGTPLAQGVGGNAAAASVAGGPIVTGTGGMSVPRGSQVSAGTPTGRRPQQQQIVQGGNVYVPGQALPYAQQMIQQYPVPFYAAAPYQQLTMAAAASVPPPSVPPPTSSAVGVPGAQPQPFQVIQTQTQHPQAAYSRQFYQQGGQPSMNYMVATATPRYAQPHTVDYNGAGAQQQQSQGSQQPSSAASSNGNSSNGQNSQPATPGPQPVASPAQMAYPLSGTPQSPHPVVMPMAHSAAPPHHAQHMFVHPSAQFPYMPAGSASYMMYSPAHQAVMQFPTVGTPVSLTQTHGQVHHQQHVGLEHYPNSSEPQTSQQPSTQSMQSQPSIPQQQFMASEQSFGPYVHPQQAIYHQQQQGGVSVATLVRQNSLGGGGGVAAAGGIPSNAQHSYQASSVASQSTMG